MPNDAISVPFEVSGQDALQRALEASAKASDRAAEALERQGKAVHLLTDDYRRLTSLNQRAAQGFHASVSGGARPLNVDTPQLNARPRLSVNRAAPYTSGPRQRLAKLQEEYKRAVAAKDENAVGDIGDRIKSTRKTIEKQDRPANSLGHEFLNVLKTSRFTIGEGGAKVLMPLVGRTLNLIESAVGPELMALAGPVGLLTGALTAGAQAVKGFADSAASAGVAYNAQAYSLGNSGNVTGQIGALNGDAAAQARAYNQAITSSPEGQLAGRMEGQQNLPGALFSKVDVGTQFWNMLEKRRHESPEMQIRLARATNTEGTLPYMSMSEDQWQLTKQQGMAQTALMNGKTQTASVSYNQAADGLAKSADRLNAALGKPFLEGITSFDNTIAKWNDGLTRWVDRLTGGGDSKEDAQKKHTEAMSKHADALMKVSGVYGSDPGGRRAAAFSQMNGYGSGAIIPGDPNTRDEMVRSGFRMGAFG